MATSEKLVEEAGVVVEVVVYFTVAVVLEVVEEAEEAELLDMAIQEEEVEVVVARAKLQRAPAVPAAAPVEVLMVERTQEAAGVETKAAAARARVRVETAVVVVAVVPAVLLWPGKQTMGVKGPVTASREAVTVPAVMESREARGARTRGRKQLLCGVLMAMTMFLQPVLAAAQ